MPTPCHQPLAYCLNMLAIHVTIIKQRCHGREAEDKGLEGQILSKASSKIDFRPTAARAQWTVNMFLSACACVSWVFVESHSPPVIMT